MRRHERRQRAGMWRGAGALLLLLGLMVPLSLRSAEAQGDEPALEIVSPAAGDVVTSDDVEVQVTVSNFTVDCQRAGLPDEAGVGHIHAMLDGMSMATLTNFYCQERFTFSGEGVTPGKHTLFIDLSTNTHLDMTETMQQVEFDYQPANARPLPEANDQGKPGVELVSPSDGATVPAVFSVEVTPVNFMPSEGLEGKQNVPGYGHYHVFVDTPMGAMAMEDMAMASPEDEEHMEMMGSPEAEMDGMHMMAMGGMIAMPGTNTFELDLTAWGPGEHTIFIEPVQNDHTNFEDFGHVEFTVVVEG